MATMTVLSDGHITIPRAALARLGIKAGDKVSLSFNQRGELVIRKTTGGDTLRGMFKRPGPADESR